MKNNNCVYFHINPVKQEVFYIGIGNENRPSSLQNRNKHWHNIVNKYGYNIVVIESSLSWDKACERERYYIKLIGRKDLGKGTLVNLTDGGEGCVGNRHSEETRQKISQVQIGKKHTDEHKRRISEGNKGKVVSKETRLKISLGNKGKSRVMADSTRLKIGNANRGKKKPKMSNETKLRISKSKRGQNLGIKFSDERRLNISRAKKGKAFSQSHRDNISKANLGKEIKPETKLKMAENMRKRWASIPTEDRKEKMDLVRENHLLKNKK